MSVAHGAVAPGEIWTAWSLNAPVLIGLVAAGLGYGIGAGKVIRRAGRRARVGAREVGAFYAGLLVLALALLTPLAALGETLFWVHMVQHLLLLVVAPPLLVYAAPLWLWMLSLPLPLRRRLASWERTPVFHATRRVVTNVLVVWMVGVAALWAWHLPTLYERALADDAVHAAEHVSFLATGLLFWSLLIRRRSTERRGYGATFLLVFGTGLASAALGAILTFASDPLYPVHESARVWGLSALEDQQLAGLVMWVPGGLVYLVTMAVLFLALFKDLERRMQRAQTRERAPGLIHAGER